MSLLPERLYDIEQEHDATADELKPGNIFVVALPDLHERNGLPNVTVDSIRPQQNLLAVWQSQDLLSIHAVRISGC